MFLLETPGHAACCHASRQKQNSACILLLTGILVISGLVSMQASAQDFPAVSPDELKLAAEPQAAGAPAIVLQRRVDRDDEQSVENVYFRIKILTEEGRKYADVEIPFDRGYVEVKNIRARITGPDGSTSNFNGQIYERDLVKGKWLRYVAKTFTFPDVRVGSILEYSYSLDLRGFLFDSRWILNTGLFTKNAQFSLRPRRFSYGAPLYLQWTWSLPVGMQPMEDPDHVIRMNAVNIPAFQEEEFMPPENELKARVDFIYLSGVVEKDSDKFWKRIGTQWNEGLDRFLGKPKPMEEALRQIVSANDPPETKLRKIYARVQAMRNRSFELEKTAKEEKRNKDKLAENVNDIWKHGYGTSVELPWLFLGLARAAGFEASGCWVSNRSDTFFNPRLLQSYALRNNVVQVKLNGKDMFFDPGSAFAPFGFLPWMETFTPGLCLDSAGGKWVRTPLPESSQSQAHHVAAFKLSPEGNLEGKLTVTYTGLEAMYHRAEERNADEVGRRKTLEELVKTRIPTAAEVQLTNQPDWSNSEAPLVAEFDVKIPNWTSNAGSRMLLPVGVFSRGEKHLFEHADRVHPIYFGYPFGQADDVTIELPEQWHVTALPKARTRKGDSITYKMDVTENNKSLHVTRELESDIYLLQKDRYQVLRGFFDAVRTGDEDQIVLQAAAPRTGN